MERYFIFDKFNTWYDWDLILTSKDLTPPEPKTNLVEIDGMSGSLDLSEALTGEIHYSDRTVTATFWTDNGNRKEREKLLRDIRVALHGKKVKIIEPDDPDHYFYGRVSVTAEVNNLAYAELEIECICDPWRYAINESERRVDVNSLVATDVIIHNNGVKTLCPTITITGAVGITYKGVTTALTTGNYKISDIKLRQGVNMIGVSGAGSAIFTYQEAEL